MEKLIRSKGHVISSHCHDLARSGIHSLALPPAARCDIQHTRWPLQKAEIEIRKNTLLHPLNLQTPATPPVVHFSKKLVVKATHLFLP
jgi:hypothetical protein